MTSVEVNCFRLLDDYARRTHHCFLAEFSAKSEETEYVLCFRPAEISRETEKRYACKYVRLSAEEVVLAGKSFQLTSALSQKLDSELRELAEIIDG